MIKANPKSSGLNPNSVAQSLLSGIHARSGLQGTQADPSPPAWPLQLVSSSLWFHSTLASVLSRWPVRAWCWDHPATEPEPSPVATQILFSCSNPATWRFIALLMAPVSHPSCLLNQNHVGSKHIAKLSYQLKTQPWSLGPRLHYPNHGETLSRRFQLSDAGLLLITADSSAPACRESVILLPLPRHQILPACATTD